jgi:hypothetical protein
MKTQKIRVYEALKKQPVKNYEFFRMTPPILRAAARIAELRKEGHDITTKKLKKGVYEFKLNRPVDFSQDNLFDAIGRPDLKPELECERCGDKVEQLQKDMCEDCYSDMCESWNDTLSTNKTK